MVYEAAVVLRENSPKQAPGSAPLRPKRHLSRGLFFSSKSFIYDLHENGLYKERRWINSNKCIPVCFSDAFFQCDSSTSYSPPPSRVGTSLTDSKPRASASGASLRRGGAQVQVGEPPFLSLKLRSMFSLGLWPTRFQWEESPQFSCAYIQDSNCETYRSIFWYVFAEGHVLFFFPHEFMCKFKLLHNDSLNFYDSWGIWL